MSSNIPAFSEVKAVLTALSHSQLKTLAGLSGVPFTTLWKMRNGPTDNPGIETVRKFMPFVAQVSEPATAPGELAEG